MNAIQFIKEHGVERARELLARLHKLGCPDDMQITVINGMWHRTTNGFTYPDLKRLVESVDLVKSYGGIINAKHDLILLQKHLSNTFGYVTIITSEKIENLEQAIADYEAIYSGAEP